MNKETFEALKRIMAILGEIQDDEVYIVGGLDELPTIHSDYAMLHTWMMERMNEEN